MSLDASVSHVFCDGLSPQGSTGRGGAPRQQWKRVLWSCRDTFRVQIGRMLVHTLSPAVPLEDRKEALEFVHEQSYSEILRESLSPGLEVRMLQLIFWQKWLFIFTCQPETVWHFALVICWQLSYLCIQSKHSSHAHFLCWEEDSDISLRCCWHTVNNPQKHLHDTVSIAAVPSSPLYCRLALKRDPA